MDILIRNLGPIFVPLATFAMLYLAEQVQKLRDERHARERRK